MTVFGTNDLVYVPEGQPLVLDDLYHWKRYKFDVHRYGFRLHPSAFEQVTDRMRATLEIIHDSPRFAESIDQITENTAAMIRDMTRHAGHMRGELPATLDDAMRGIEATWWLHLTDLPSETFFEDDYERVLAPVANPTPHPTFGMARIAQLDGLEVGLAGDEKDDDGNKVLPFSVDVPAEGLTRWTLPALEPLPLIHEFCGVHGASCRGATINIDTNAMLAESHQFCTPLGRLGTKLFVTLYLHVHTPTTTKVMGRVRPDHVLPAAALLEQSGFRLHNDGPTHRIYEREGDVVHLYSQLAGKETEGVATMPPFLLVASASGQYDPMHRGELYEAIRETLRQQIRGA